jgi:hypothetical protein
MPDGLVDLVVYLAGAALLGGLVRCWQPLLSARAILASGSAAFAFVAPALLGPGHQVATDIAYGWAPFQATIEARVRPGNELLSDPLLHMLPYRILVRERLLDGRAPLWANELATGLPLAGNAQSAPFSPLNLLSLPLPPLRAMTVTAAWQLLLGLLFVQALLRRLGASAVAAGFAGTAFAFSTYAVAWLYYPLGLAAMFLPGLLVGVLTVRDRGPHAVAGLALVAAGLGTAGHPETLLHGALVVAVQVLWLLAGRSDRLRFVGHLAASGALAFTLAAPALLPVLETVAESQRLAMVQRPGPKIDSPPLPPHAYALLVDPLRFGSPRDGNWRGPSNFNETATLYAGALTLVLALVGATTRRGALALLGGLAALGAALRLPPFFHLVDALPGLEHAVHGRLRCVWLLGLVVAAGLGLDRLLDGGRRALAAGAALAVLGALFAWPPPALTNQQLWWAATLLGLATFAGLLAVRRWQHAWGWAALGLLPLDLGLLGLHYNPIVSPQLDLSPPPVIERLQRLSSTEPAPLRVIARGHDLFPHLSALYGLWDPRGTDPTMPVELALFQAQSLRPAFRPGNVQAASAPTASDEWLGFLRVGFLLTPRRDELPPPWQLDSQGGGGRIWRHPAPLPLFFQPRSAVAAAPQARLRRALAEPAPLERVVLDEAELRRFGLEHLTASPAPASPLPIEVLGVSANGFVLRSAGGGGVIASSVTWAPGWRAVGADRRLPVLHAHAAFLGVAAPTVPTQLELRFLPASWPLGLGLAALGLSALLALTLPRPRSSTEGGSAE